MNINTEWLSVNEIISKLETIRDKWYGEKIVDIEIIWENKKEIVWEHTDGFSCLSNLYNIESIYVWIDWDVWKVIMRWKDNWNRSISA